MPKDYTPKPDTGTLFANTFKTKPEHPDYTGQYATADGIIREFAVWTNARGYLSVKFQDQYETTTKKTA